MTLMELYSHTFTLTAGDCDCARRMPVTLLLRRIIEVATLHANALHIGWADLAPLNIGWVLSRVHIHFDRTPGPNEELTLQTWVQDWSRLYSNRAFTLLDAQGVPVAHALTMWVCIDLTARTAADIGVLHGERFINSERTSPLPRLRKLPLTQPDAATLVGDHRFVYSDLDFNGHVNSARYAEAILNLWPQDTYLGYMAADFVINYLHECRYGQRATVAAAESLDADTGAMTAAVTLWTDGATAAANAAVTFVPVRP